MKDKGQNNNHNLSECQKSIFTLSTQHIDLHLIDTKRNFNPHWIACSTIQILFTINLEGKKTNPFLYKEFSFKYLSLLGAAWKTHTILPAYIYRGWCLMCWCYLTVWAALPGTLVERRTAESFSCCFHSSLEVPNEDLGVVYLYCKEWGMLIGRPSLIFRS